MSLVPLPLARDSESDGLGVRTVTPSRTQPGVLVWQLLRCHGGASGGKPTATNRQCTMHSRMPHGPPSTWDAQRLGLGADFRKTRSDMRSLRSPGSSPWPRVAPAAWGTRRLSEPLAEWAHWASFNFKKPMPTRNSPPDRDSTASTRAPSICWVMSAFRLALMVLGFGRVMNLTSVHCTDPHFSSSTGPVGCGSGTYSQSTFNNIF